MMQSEWQVLPMVSSRKRAWRIAVAVLGLLSFIPPVTGGAARVPPPVPDKPTSPMVAKDGLITLTFKDTDIKDIFTGISLVTGASIVADSSVQGKIPFLSLRGVPLEEAIKSLAAANGLAYLRSGNVYTIGRNLNVKPVTATYHDNKLTLEATRADIKDVLQAVGQATGVNFIPAQDIQKAITVSLQEVELESALEALLEQNGLQLKKKSERLYVVENKPPPAPAPRTTSPSAPSPGTQARPPETVAPTTSIPVRRSDKVTLTLDNASLAEILKRIAEQTGATFVLTTQLDDRIRRSVRLIEVSVEEALSAVLAGTKYAYVRSRTVEGNNRNSNEEPSQKPVSPEKPSDPTSNPSGVENSSGSENSAQDTGSQPKEAAKGPVQQSLPPHFLIGEVSNLTAPEAAPFLLTEIVPLRHLRATEASNLFSARVIKDAVRPLKDQNALSLTGTQEQIERIKAELRSLDTPAPQIMIQAVVVETTLTALKDLGIEYLAQNNEIQAAGPTGSTLIFRTTGGFGKQFTATLTALITQGRAKILANPRVATINGKEASIDITDTRYFRTAGFPQVSLPGGGAPSNQGAVISPFAFGTIQSIDAGIKLKITPWVGADGDIQVDVTPEVSSVVGTGPEGLPELSRRTATTTIRVKNGESILIGGLRQKDESKSVTKPFLLGDIPLIGNLFRRTVKNRRESDLMIMITPTVIKSAPMAQLEEQLPLQLRKLAPTVSKSLDLRRSKSPASR